MKDRRFRLLAILLSLSILGAACSKNETTEKTKKKTESPEYEQHEMETKDPDAETSETEETTEPSQRDTSARTSPTPTPTPEVIPILTEADIQSMNNNDAIIVKNDEGHVSTIVGRFFHRPVADVEEAIDAVKGVAELLGLKGYFPLAMYGATYDGYTYFTLKQNYDDLTVQNATLKIVLDPEGYPCMLQSSLVTNLGYAVSDPKINGSQAEQIVLSQVGAGYSVMHEYTKKTCLADEISQAQHCFQVVTNNPAGTIGFDMPYIIHFVDYDGNYIKSYPTGFLPDDSNIADYGNDSYFTDLVPENRTYTIDRNGESYTFTVPISYNSVDQQYYMADPSRKIIVADFFEFEFNDRNLVFETSSDPDNWSENHLITYYNYIRSYDFYNAFHIQSTDSFGMPMLILTGYCDENREPVNNACNMGVTNGWSVFGAADVNTYCYSLDVCAHEFTHGVSGFARQGNIYANEFGAINEAFSDIMGNICEMYMGDTWDTDWLLGETSGNTMRSMSNPYMYNQPIFIGDPYYLSPSLQGMYGIQDNGGVHINNTLISYLCYKLYAAGMTLDDLTRFFLCAMEMHTPTADYDDLYAIFVAAAQMCGHAEIIPVITQHWDDTNLTGDRSKNAESVAISGFQRINIPFESYELATHCIVSVYYSNGQIALQTLSQPDGVASILIPADDNSYFIIVEEYSDEFWSTKTGEKALDYYGTGWTTDANNMGSFTMDSGDVATLPVYS